MSESRNSEQKFRLIAAAIGVTLLTVFWAIHSKNKYGLQELERAAPTLADPDRARSEELEGAILHVAVPLLVLGAEAVIFLTVAWSSEWGPAKRMDRAFTASPKIRMRSLKFRPVLITSDIDACLTPPARRVINLRNVFKIRRYCEHVHANPDYPPFILVSARAQEYTELMCQTLGLINGSRDVPCVLENGMALYWPYARIVEEPLYVTQEMKNEIKQAKATLLEKLEGEFEFEPKRHMITINVERQRSLYGDNLAKRRDAVLALRRRVEEILRSADGVNFNELLVTSTINAVDVIPKGVSKLEGLREVLRLYNESNNTEHKLSEIAAIGNSEADEALLQEVGLSFCSVHEADRVVKLIVQSANEDHVLMFHNSDAVVEMIEKVTGLKLP